MLTEAVLDGSQAMRDPVGGSVEFHFVPILKLISTLLIMGIFNDEDTKHILKMIDPNVFSGKEEGDAEGEKALEGGAAESEEAKEEDMDEDELEDEGVGEEEDDEEKGAHEGEEAEPKEEGEEGDKEGQAKAEKVDGEKAEEEKEAEAVEAEAKEEDDGLEEGLLQMKLPESVKLQVNLIFKL